MTDRHNIKPKSVRLPASLMAWLKQQAKKENRSAHAIIIAAIEEYRDRRGGPTKGGT